MKKIFEQLKDLHIRKFVVFANAEDSKLYKDARFESQLEEAELQEYFKKGMLVINLGEDVFAEPIKVDANKAYVVDVVTSAVALVEFVAKAAE